MKKKLICLLAFTIAANTLANTREIRPSYARKSLKKNVKENKETPAAEKKTWAVEPYQIALAASVPILLVVSYFALFRKKRANTVRPPSKDPVRQPISETAELLRQKTIEARKSQTKSGEFIRMQSDVLRRLQNERSNISIAISTPNDQETPEQLLTRALTLEADLRKEIKELGAMEGPVVKSFREELEETEKIVVSLGGVSTPLPKKSHLQLGSAKKSANKPQ